MREDQVLASVEVVTARLGRLRALSGRMDGALVFRPAWATHTLGAPGRVDIVFCDSDLVVLEILAGVAPNRVTRLRPRARSVIGAEAGFIGRHGLAVGDRLEIKE
ncbi:MAG: DUF192 domain-containing protein [Acidimicrobiales bacterium]